VADLLGRVVAARNLDKQRSAPPSWLWHGYLGPGKLTLLTSQWKSGKTTLVSLLLARMQNGGLLAGLPVAAGKAFVISEESEADWRARFQSLGAGDSVDLLCRPFAAQPTMDQWLALIETAAALHDRQGTALLVIDSLAHFLPAHNENSAAGLLECLTPLQRLATAGMSVLLPHHPRKGKTVAGQAARGSGALPGFVDILIEMAYFGQPDDLDRRRRLVAFSRHDETPRHLLIELKPGGTDYMVLQSGVEASFGERWQAVLDVLGEASSKLTRQEILEKLPDDDKPDSSTLWRWLARAVAEGVVRQEGRGRPQDPLRYWLPARQNMMRPDGGTIEDMQAWNDRCLAELFEKLAKADGAASREDEARSEDEDLTAAASVAAPERPTIPVKPVPPAQAPETAASPSPTADPPPPQPAKTILARRPKPDVCLPFPFNIMNPAEVPDEVWKRAAAPRGNT
jgi:hypothetical protein